MRIVVVCPGWPGVVNPWNGIFIKDQAIALVELGCNVSVVTARVFEEDQPESKVGSISVHRFWFPSEQKLLADYEGIPFVRVSFYLLSGILKTISVSRRQKSDVIQGHFAVPSGFIAAIAGLLTRKPIIVTVHDSDVQTFPAKSRLAALCIRFTLKRAKRIVTTNEELARYVTEHYPFAAAKLRICPLGVNTKLFNPVDHDKSRRELGLPLDRKIAIYIGALLEIKGVDYLYEVVPKVLEKDKNALFLVIGKGPMRGWLEKQIAKDNLGGHVRIIGQLTHEEIPLWLGSSDVLVLSTRSEGQGMVVHEAVAMGVPVVSSRVGGIPNVVEDGANGFLVAPGDIQTFAESIVKVFSNSGFKKEALARSELAKKFGEEAAARSLLDVFEEAANP